MKSRFRPFLVPMTRGNNPMNAIQKNEPMANPPNGMTELACFQLKSPTIGKLAEALAKAQAEIKNAAKDKDNPFYKSTYADLASVWDACREPLSKNGLSVTQPFSFDDKGRVILHTLLLHSSGEWICSQIPLNPVKNDPQGMGSAMTYMKRFSLSSIVGVAPSEKITENDVDDADDDGNAASGKLAPKGILESPKMPIKSAAVAKTAPPTTTKSSLTYPTEGQLKRIYAIAQDRKVPQEQVDEYIFTKYRKNSRKELTQAEYTDVCDSMTNGTFGTKYAEVCGSSKGAFNLKQIPTHMESEDVTAPPHEDSPPWDTEFSSVS